MQALTDHPTPETDECFAANWGIGVKTEYHKALSKSLEQRLAACREALRLAILWGEGMSRHHPNREEINWTAIESARDTLTLTAPLACQKP
jgi:hypothetical protein